VKKKIAWVTMALLFGWWTASMATTVAGVNLQKQWVYRSALHNITCYQDPSNPNVSIYVLGIDGGIAAVNTAK